MTLSKTVCIDRDLEGYEGLVGVPIIVNFFNIDPLHHYTGGGDINNPYVYATWVLSPQRKEERNHDIRHLFPSFHLIT